jgi:uncharacterized delta-60 repeat protein
VLLLLLLLATTRARAQSALDGFDPNSNGTVRVTVVQPDGKILLGGSFVSLSPNGGPAVARNGIARLNPDGTLDTAFNPNANGTVRAIVLQADGKILVGGSFHGANSIGGQARNYIARLDPVTGAADSFDPNANADVFAIALQANGKILVGGSFHGANSIGGQARNHLARLEPTTGLADSFDPNSNESVSSIAVQADGRILVGGSFSGPGSIGGAERNHIARLDPLTGLPDAFNPNADDNILAIAVQADGNILVGGLFATIGGQPRNRIARLDSRAGEADSFDPHASHSNPSYTSAVNSIALQPDGTILVGGFFTNIGGQTRNNIARINRVTGLADSLDSNPNDVVYAIAVQPDGKILTGGNFFKLTPNGGPEVARSGIARLETDGRLDQTLRDVIRDQTLHATAVQPGGKILIGGGFNTVLGVPRGNIARLNPDGTLDTTFNPNGNGTVVSIAVQADGKILVGGRFTSIGGQPRNNIARLDPTTGQADSFNPNATGRGSGDIPVNSLIVLADGRILAGGRFSSIGGEARNGIARLDPLTGLADAFDPNSGGGAYDSVDCMAIQADGKILVGGYFRNMGGQPRNCIARLDPVSGLADSFDPNAITGFVSSIAVQRDGKVLAAGDFYSIGGQPYRLIARLDPVTGLADSFNPNPTGGNIIYAVVLQANGKILVGGEFSAIGGQPRGNFARLDPATGAADSFAPNTGTGAVWSIAVQQDGRILLGGYRLITTGGQTRGAFARLSSDTAALQDLVATQTTVTWTRSGSSPELTNVTFEYSSDNVNYTPLGNGTAAGSAWTLAGLSLPFEQNFYIRARGYYQGGISTGSESITESVRNVFLSPTYGNISSRGRVETGDNAMIGGFTITGTQQKTVILRGLGPSLSLTGAISDPIIEVHGPSGELLGGNDNWRSDPNQQHVVDSGLAPSNELESALWGIINPGAYTVILRDKNGNSGTGVFEVYDLDQTAEAQLANVSTRGLVQTGDDVLIGGVIVLGQRPRRIIVRAIGPSLAVTGRLQDPLLELHDGNGGLIVTNDNWRTDQEAEISATSIPLSHDSESAIVHDLAPGNYTAVVRGANNSAGIAVVEAYALD